MNFIAVNELKSPRALRERLRKEHELLLTNNGRPMAVILNLEEGEDPEEYLRVWREARVDLALRRIRAAAREAGTDQMTMAEIDEEIQAARRERRTRK